MGAARLPVDEVLPDLVEALEGERAAVLIAPTGAGKSTRVPTALLDAGLAGDRAVWVLEPRRLAARAVARRMAEERGGALGDEVGFQVRFERRLSERTRVEVMTEGVLLRRLQEDPFIERAGVVVFDEFHERNLASDLALAICARLRADARPDLALCVLSATLDPSPVAAFLGDAPIVESRGRTYPVDVHYLDPGPRAWSDAAAAQGVESILDRTPGDVLAFLPGRGEIRRTASRLQSSLGRRGIDLHELYGELPRKQQDLALRAGPRRKVVLATNVAETSVTIEGVTGVVDTGVARISRFDPGVGLDRLELGPIARASSDQRTGRAGRTAPGYCLRMGLERDWRSRPAREEPEVRRVDLAPALLQLAAWGEPDLGAFPWFEAPQADAIERGLEVLRRLGALEGERLTRFGESLANIPAHPRIAALLRSARETGAGPRAATVAALLAERDPFDRSLTPRNTPLASDPYERALALERFGFQEAEAPAALKPGAARFAWRARDLMLRSARIEGRDGGRDSVTRALLRAYPDRVAKRRSPGDPRAVMVGGRGVRILDEDAVADHGLVLCVDVDAGRRGERAEAQVRQLVGLERAWLDPGRIGEHRDQVFDPSARAVVEVRQQRYMDLVLEEHRETAQASPEVEAALLEAAAEDPEAALDLGQEGVADFLARARSLAHWCPELELPTLDTDDLRAVLPMLCSGCRSFADLRKAPLLHALKSRFTPRQLQQVEREAPERVAVPSGSRIRLKYEAGKPPVLAARIQELFGMPKGPRVAQGRVPVLLHLLAPNHRPQQVTDDLESFWANTYPLVRKELRRRYPRHAWPEDPTTATAEKRPRRRSN